MSGCANSGYQVNFNGITEIIELTLCKMIPTHILYRLDNDVMSKEYYFKFNFLQTSNDI